MSGADTKHFELQGIYGYGPITKPENRPASMRAKIFAGARLRVQEFFHFACANAKISVMYATE
jgi:hypothetical protein